MTFHIMSRGFVCCRLRLLYHSLDKTLQVSTSFLFEQQKQFTFIKNMDTNSHFAKGTFQILYYMQKNTIFLLIFEND